MTPIGLEPVIPARERLQTHAVDRTNTRMGWMVEWTDWCEGWEGWVSVEWGTLAAIRVFVLVRETLYCGRWISPACQFNLLNPTSFKVQNSTFLSPYIYMLCVYLRTNRKICPTQHSVVGFYYQNGIYCVVRTGSLSRTDFFSSLKG
jgi:hypothetical protein